MLYIRAISLVEGRPKQQLYIVLSTFYFQGKRLQGWLAVAVRCGGHTDVQQREPHLGTFPLAPLCVVVVPAAFENLLGLDKDGKAAGTSREEEEQVTFSS